MRTVRKCKDCGEEISSNRVWRKHVEGHASSGSRWAKGELDLLNRLAAYRRKFREETSIVPIVPEEFVKRDEPAEVASVVQEHVEEPTKKPNRGQQVDALSESMANLLAEIYRRLSYKHGMAAFEMWDNGPEAFEEFSKEYIRKLGKAQKTLKKLRRINQKRMSTECEGVR